MTTRTLPDSITLTTPENWSDFPIDPDEFKVFRRQIIEGLAERDDVGRADQRQAEVFLTGLHRLAVEHRVFLAAGVIDLLEPADEGGDPTPMMASVVASTVLRRELGIDVPLLPEVLVRSFSAERSDDGSMVFDDIEPPKTTTLGDAEVVRLVRLMRSTRPGEEGLRQFVESFLVPVSEGDGVVILQFATINLDHAPQFSEVFGKIAETLRILYPDDPTPLGDESDPEAEGSG